MYHKGKNLTREEIVSIKAKILEIIAAGFFKWVVLIAFTALCYYFVVPKYQFDRQARYNLISGDVEVLVKDKEHPEQLKWVDVRDQHRDAVQEEKGEQQEA